MSSLVDSLQNVYEGGLRRVKRLPKTYRHYQLRRRRARSVKRKASRKLTWLLALVLLLLLGGFALAQDYLKPDLEGSELTFGELTALARDHRVASSTFLDEDNVVTGSYAAEPLIEEEPKKEEKKRGEDKKAEGKRNDPEGKNADKGDNSKDKQKEEKKEPEPILKAPPGAGDFYVTLPASGSAFGPVSELLVQSGAEVKVDSQTSKTIVRAVSTYLLPLLILAAAFGLLFTGSRAAGSQIGEVLNFGSIGDKRRRRSQIAPVGFQDVGGEDEAVAELREVVDYLSDPERYEELGAAPPKGVLLFGPPGCGKTLLAKAVAGEAGVPFFSVAGAEFVESLVGVGAARVRDLFNRVRAVAPAIVFIDELDAAGRRRGHGEVGGSDEREQTLNQLLVEMDGFEVSAGIVVIGATNRPDILDPALLRPGRFDRHITVDQPDHEGRKVILHIHARGRPIAADVDFDYIAKRTPGFSGADLANVINEAALLTIRENKVAIETPELEEAIQRVLHGPKRKGVVLTLEERKRVAYHEIGHAVVASVLGDADAVHRVTILARSRGLGASSMTRQGDSLLKTRDQLFEELVISLAGIVSEELVFGTPSTGAEQDVEHATNLARDLVGRYGMSPRLGRIRLIASDIDQYLGVESSVDRFSEQTLERFDEEIGRVIAAAEEAALNLLIQNRGLVDKLAERLLETETLEGPELASYLREVPISGVVAPFDPAGNGHKPTTRAEIPKTTS